MKSNKKAKAPDHFLSIDERKFVSFMVRAEKADYIA